MEPGEEKLGRLSSTGKKTSNSSSPKSRRVSIASHLLRHRKDGFKTAVEQNPDIISVCRDILKKSHEDRTETDNIKVCDIY